MTKPFSKIMAKPFFVNIEPQDDDGKKYAVYVLFSGITNDTKNVARYFSSYKEAKKYASELEKKLDAAYEIMD